MKCNLMFGLFAFPCIRILCIHRSIALKVYKTCITPYMAFHVYVNVGNIHNVFVWRFSEQNNSSSPALSLSIFKYLSCPLQNNIVQVIILTLLHKTIIAVLRQCITLLFFYEMLMSRWEWLPHGELFTLPIKVYAVVECLLYLWL